ncbi:MAG: ribonuclease P protein component, partial [Rhodobacteraceae bacterium]|nr:ribonuclease P protein component [Paracoccaceae bacterium]
ASRKVGNAVARNRAKRRLRALCDRVITRDDTRTFDFVLIARTEAVTRDFALMEDELRNAVGRLIKGDGAQRRGEGATRRGEGATRRGDSAQRRPKKRLAS